MVSFTVLLRMVLLTVTLVLLLRDTFGTTVTVSLCGKEIDLSQNGTALTTLSGCETLPSQIGLLSDLEVIALTKLQLKGTIPTEVGQLRKLHTLNLRINRIGGQLSPSLGNLTSLTFLSLENNRLEGGIPAEFSGMNSLTFLDLRRNDLEGEFPEALKSLSRLKELKLQRNDLKGNLPTQWGHLTGLSVLNLGRNNFRGNIPPSLSAFASLAVLNLEHNKFTGALPSEMGLLVNMVHLDVSDNDMDSILPTEFGQLVKLTRLDLEDADLVGAIPTELGRLPKLETLELQYNKMAGTIPTEIFAIETLVSLDLSHNKLTRQIPSQLSRLKALTFLNIHGAKLTGTIPGDVIAKLPSLRVLDLHTNKLSSSIPEVLGNMPSLRRIILRNNKLTSTVPSTFHNLVNLTHLSLGQNELEGEIFPLVTNLTRLRMLDLRHSKFVGEYVPSQLARLRQLRNLNLANMRLKGGFPEVLLDLPALREIRIQRNRFTGQIPAALFTNLEQLSVLNVEQNEFTGTIPTEIGLSKEFISIDLDINQLNGSIPTEIGGLGKLTRLDLDFNKLSGPIAVDLMSLRRLRYFIIDDNLMTGTIPTQVGRLGRLEFFTIDNNLFHGTVPTQLGSLTRMRDFELDRNHFTGSIPSQLGNLEILGIMDLDSNAFTSTMPTEIFSLAKLSQLFLNHNQFNGSLPRDLSGLERIKALHVNANDLTGLLPESLWNLDSLESLRLDNNPQLEVHVPRNISNLDSLVFLSLGNVVCDCKLLEWFGDFVNASNINNAYDAAVCSSINSFAGLFPLNARIDDNAPCSHVLPSFTFPSTPSSLNVSFEYPYLEEILHLVQPPPELRSAFTNRFSVDDKALEQSEIAALFGSCENMYIEDAIEDVSVLGFEISLNARRSDRSSVKHCHFAVNIQRLPSVTSDHGFLATISNLHPATEYEVLIRPFYLQLRSNSYLSYTFGPASRRLFATTNSKAPPIAPPEFRPISIGSRFFAVAWNTSTKLVENGEIKGYEVEITGLDGNQSSITIATRDRTLLVDIDVQLQPQSTYFLRLRARTGAKDFGPFSTPINVTTCTENTRRDLTTGECIAEVGYYVEADIAEAVSCRAIRTINGFNPLQDSACLDIGSAVNDLPILPGFWRASLSSSMIEECPRTDFCLQTWINWSVVEGTPNQYCTNQHLGVYCSECAEGFALSAAGCASCDESETDLKRERELAFGWAVTAIVAFQICLFIYVMVRAKVWVCCRRAAQQRGGSDKSIRSIKAAIDLRDQLGISVKMRILLGFFQVLFAYHRIVQPFAQSESAWMAFLDYISNLALDKIFGNASVRCIYDYNHYDLLLFSTLYPLALIGLLFLMCGVAVQCCNAHRRSAVWMRCISTSYFVLFLVYPSVSQTIFSTFWCQDFPDADVDSGIKRSVLRGSYRIACDVNDPQRVAYLIYAGVMVVVYPVGVVVFYLVTLLEHRKTIMKEEYSTADKRSLESVEFLIYPYKKEKYWFEAYELLRKILQTSLIGFFQGLVFEQTSTTSFLALIEFNLCVAFLLLLLVLRPYSNKLDHYFAVFSIFLFIPMTQLSIIDPFSLDTNITGLETLVAIECLAFAIVVFYQTLLEYRNRRMQRTEDDLVESSSRNFGGTSPLAEETAVARPKEVASNEAPTLLRPDDELLGSDKGETSARGVTVA